MKTRHLLLLFISILLLLDSKAQEIGFPIIRNYTPKEYNNAPQVFAAIQDNRGIMYFGIGGEVVEYDGISWRSITIDKQAPIYDLALAENGKIYVGAIDEFGYLKPNKKGNTIYQSLTYLITDTTYKIGAVRSVKPTSKMVFFQTYDAILQYSPNNDKLTIFKADTNGRFSGDFIYENNYYVRLSKKGLMKIEDGELKQAIQSDFFKNKNSFLPGVSYDSTTQLIPTRTEGLILYKPDLNADANKLTISDNDFILDNNIYSALKYLNKYFVFGSLKKGGLLIDQQGTVLRKYNENNLLQSNQIYRIITDRNQNLWFGLSKGISKTDHSLDLSYWNQENLLRGSVQSVIRYRETIYIGTEIKVYFINKKNQIQEVQNIPAGQNWCFLENKYNESLLVGTQYGIYEIKGDNAELVYNGSHAFKLFQSVQNPSRVFCADYNDFVSIRSEAGKWIIEGKWDGIKDEIRGIIEDENGDVWLGTFRNGVIRVTPNNENITKPKKSRYYNKKDGFVSLKNILPFKFKNRIIWGSEKGLYSYNPKNDKFEPFRELGEQFCNVSREVFSFIEMPDGKIWISPLENKNADIGYLQPNSKGGYDWIYAPFRRIPEMFLTAFYAEPSGITWIGGSEGLYRYDLHKDTKNYLQPIHCYIRRITAGADSLLYGGNYTNFTTSTDSEALVNYQFNTLKFEYAAPFFDQEDKTLYSYKLKGYDKEWSKWSRESRKEYTNLQEGTYTFQVKAHNVYDVESEIDTFQITVLPPLYKTWWAYCLYFILLATFIFTIVKLYTRLLRDQKERLKQIVKDRTIEILLQKDELQAINEELESTVHSLKETERQLIQSEKMASLGVLAAGVAHEINNPLNFIHGGIAGIEQYFNENLVDHKLNVEFYINGVNEGVKRAVDIVSGLNHYSRSGEFITEEINVHTLIDNCLLILQNNTKYRIEIIKKYTNEPYTLVGNEGKLHQAIINIIANAVQAIDDQGIITIKTEIEAGKIKIYVSDTGGGISEENLPKILDPFFTTKDPGKGTGLGLSITYNILQEHNGTIGFESELGNGTTTVITLPLNDPIK